MQAIGKRIPRVDGIEKAAGAALYVGDLKLPGLLVGMVLRSPYPHAEIRHIDVSRARALPGVKAVVTFHDTPKILWNSAGFPPTPGSILLEDQYILTDKARYAGDPVAAVAAVDEEIAREALALLQVDYEPLPFVLNVEEAMREGAPLVHGAGTNLAASMTNGFGDLQQGFSEADFVFEDRYVTSKVFPCSLEPCGASVAEYSLDGKLTIWASTQMPHLVRRIVAIALGLTESDVRIIKPHVGGAFGSRLGAVNEPICGLLAKKAHRPVKLIYSREESFHTESRHPIVFALKTGVKKDGTFTARQMQAWLNAGAYATHTASFAAPVGNWFLGMYKSFSASYNGNSIYTNTSPAGAFRGYGNPQAVFAVESQVDAICSALQLDPLEFRLKNHPCKGDIWFRTKWPIESCGLEEAIARGSQSIGWAQKHGRASGNPGAIKKRGVGMAYMLHSSGAGPRLHEISTAIIKLNEDGKANLIYATSDSGQGSATVLSQIAAEAMGLNAEDVRITNWADTDVAGFEIGSHASRQIYSGGHAVYTAALDARKKLLEHASLMLGAPTEEIEVQEGRAFLKNNPERSLSVAEISYDAHFGKEGHQIIGLASKEPTGNPPVYAAQFVEVEVDTETGQVEVVQVAAAHDCGVALNPTFVEGQIEGAIQQGLGYAVTENAVYDPLSGRLLNPNLTDYKMLMAKDMPRLEAIVVQAASASGPYGAKSIGESGLVATAAAVANAVYDAIGVRIRELPITPEKILAALKEKNRKEK